MNGAQIMGVGRCEPEEPNPSAEIFMRGLMMDKPLLIQSLIDYAARYHGNTEVVSRTTEGRLYQYTYAQANTRAKQLARALLRLGVGFGDRVATLAWNNHRHFRGLLRDLRYRCSMPHHQS